MFVLSTYSSDITFFIHVSTGNDSTLPIENNKMQSATLAPIPGSFINSFLASNVVIFSKFSILTSPSFTLLVASNTYLSLNPKLIIIDEPTIYLDNKKEEYLIKLLKKMKNNYHKTIIIFTSDIEFALKITDNYAVLKNGKIIRWKNRRGVKTCLHIHILFGLLSQL